MVQFPWQFWSDPNAAIAPSVRQIGNRARDIGCDLYRRFPRWLTGDYGAVALPNPVRLLWDMMCQDPADDPPGPEVPFTGGQCPVRYTVVVNFSAAGGAPGLPPANFNVTLRPYGPIRGLRITANGGGGKSLDLIGAEFFDPNIQAVYNVTTWTDSAYSGETGTIVSLTREDGQPDECGDPPPEWPDVMPEPGDLTFVTNINIDGVDVSVPVIIPTINFNPNFNFQPQFTVDIGGVRVTIDLGGIDFSFDPTINLPRIPSGPDPRPPADRPPPVTPPTPGNGGECPDVNLEPVLTAIAEVKQDTEEILALIEELLNCDRCKREPITFNGYALRSSGAAQSGVVQLDPKSRWVRLEITQTPANARIQWGVDAPDVYFAGWYFFITGASANDRRPVHFLDNAYETVEGSQSFAYTLPAGYLGVVTDVYQVGDD